MANRVYGPRLGAGTQVEERSGARTVSPALLGWVGYAGILEKGDPGKMMVLSSKKQFEKRCGSYISDSTLPDNCFDYFDQANGTGGILLVRVTDGTEVAASKDLFGRRSTRTLVGRIKAKNGGRWGGKAAAKTGLFASSGDLAATAATTGVTMLKDQFKGGTLELAGVPSKTYKILGNTTAGVITVDGDQTMSADLAGGVDSSNLRWYASIVNDAEAVSFIISDGDRDPTNEFGISVFVDGGYVKTYQNLSMDPAKPNYWVDEINNDTGNFEIVAEAVWTGAYTSDIRPANSYGVIGAIDAATLTATIHELVVTTSPTGANPTAALGATLDVMKAQKLTITMTAPTTFTVVSDKFGSAGGSGTLGVAYVPTNKWTPGFTITNGSTVLASGDVLTLVYKPFPVNGLINGFVHPDKVNGSTRRFRVISNTHKVITVAAGSDMVGTAPTGGAVADLFYIEYPEELEGGSDGNAGVVDATYTQKAWSLDTSPFLKIDPAIYGLVKFATPGVTSSTVQRAGRTFAELNNYQYRYEVPVNTTTDEAAVAWINDTLGRSDYAVCAFPSFAYVPDPQATVNNKLKLIPQTGAIQGREARIAADADGYHRAQAGEIAVLPRIKKLPSEDMTLNEEYLNPRGIAVLKLIGGNYVIWGDQNVYQDTEWKWKHQRELMSYYEHILRPAFTFIVFGLNDATSRAQVRTTLESFFRPEYKKGALDKDFPFEKACEIKIDKENNTPATKAAGDEFVDISLRLVDVVERLRIRMSKAGIFETRI